MGRKLTGKTHIGERRETRPNGDIYVYERVTAYNEKTRKTYTVSQRLKGKIMVDAKTLVPTRPRKMRAVESSSATVSAVRKHVGLMDILDWVGMESGIDHDVKASFDLGDAAKIISIARYWTGTDGSPLPRLESWQIMHELPYSEGISEDIYGDLFKSIGRNEDSVQRYFSCRASKLGDSPLLAFDSTTISTYSINQKEARQGFNKENDGLNTIKLLTMYSVRDCEPIAFAKQPGNVPDVISLENALAQLKCLSLDKPLIVTDNGYYSQANMMEFARRNMKFLTLASANVTWVRGVVDSLREELDTLSTICPFDPGVSGATLSLMHPFRHVRQRTRNGKSVGDVEEFNRRLYAHVFRVSDTASKQEVAFRKALMELKEQVEEGETEFTDAAQKKIEKYLIRICAGRGGRLKVSFNEATCAEAKRNFGIFVLVSNKVKDTFEALRDYRLREKIEELFAIDKGSMDGRRPRTWYPDNLRGRQFVQFIGLGYYCFLSNRLRDVQGRLGIPSADKTATRLKLEMKLKNWLKNRSLQQILDWFDCIERTDVKTQAGAYRWSTESVARDRLLLEELGVLKK